MKKIICFFTILSCLNILGQEKKWTLEDCISYAKEHSFDIATQQLANQKLAQDKIKAKGNFLPNLSFDADQNYLLGNSFNPSTGVGQVASRSNTFSVSSSITLFNGLSNINTLKLTKLTQEKGLLELEKTKKNLELTVTDQFLQVLFNKEILKIANAHIEVSRKQLERVTVLYTNGAVAKSELLENKSLVESDQNEIITAQNNLATSFLKLKELISVNDIAEFDVKEIDIESNETTLPLLTPDNEAINKNPALLVEKSNIEINDTKIKIEKAALYPKLTFDYSYGTGYYHIQGRNDLIYNTITNKYENNDFLTQLDKNKMHYLFFKLTIPIFSRFANSTAIKKAKLDRNTAELNYAFQKRALQNDMQIAQSNAIVAKSSLESTFKIVTFQDETFRAATQKYELGAIKIYDFIESRNRLVEAQSNLIKSKYDLIIKIKILGFYFNN